MNSLELLRNEIDEIDERLALLFERRMNVSRLIAKVKADSNMDILDSSREDEVIKHNLANIINEDLKKYYKPVVEKILEESKNYQKELIEENKWLSM